MPTNIDTQSPDTLEDSDLLTPWGPVNPSPWDWRDQILYFLLPDRFSDGNEADNLYNPDKPDQYRAPDKKAWMEAGKKFVGGKIKGIRSKLPYLKDLGITTLWIGPVFRQRPDLQTYHGYGIQDFLEVDPRFGTKKDLRNIVDAAHEMGMYVLLDIIYNHTGNNWYYNINGNPYEMINYRYSPPYPFHGWRSKNSQSTSSIQSRDDGVFPKEFQNRDWYSRSGKIERWDPEYWEDPMDPRNEFRRGDFFDLKNLKLNELEEFSGDVLSALIKVYQYWIALTDCDGFRVDTVKHVSKEASRNFCGAIHEYTESIGKENFLILGEVAGGAYMSRNYLEIFGRNLDAVIDLGGPMNILTGFSKGLSDPMEFFKQYGGHDDLGSHREVGHYHVAMFDDHDVIGRYPKRRFSAENTIPNQYQQVAHAVGIQLTTLGIPCIYYGTEQAFDGWEGYHDPKCESLDENGNIHFADRYIREAMFASKFGAFETENCHFFNQNHPTYLRIAAIAKVVHRNDLIGQALRRGRQYWREVCFYGANYLPPQQGELVAWSRVLFSQEVVIAVNTNGVQNRGGKVTVDFHLHPPGTTMQILYRSDWTDAQLKNPPSNKKTTVQNDNGRAVVRIDLPPAGMTILA